MGHTLQVPVRPHIKKYLEKKYGSPFVLTERNPFGKYLLMALSKPYFKKSYHDYLAQCTARLPVALSDYCFFEKRCLDLSPKMAYDFNRLVHGYMMQELFDYVSISSRYIPIRQCIYDFIWRYGLEEGKEVTYSALRKAHYRHSRIKN